jgi:mRNA interferase MazF
MAGRLIRGEVRLVRFPAPDKERPAVILTQDSAIEYLNTVTVAPVTSSIRGIKSQVVLDETDGMKAPCVVNLHNIVTLPKRCVGSRVTQLSRERVDQICAAMNFALGCS